MCARRIPRTPDVNPSARHGNRRGTFELRRVQGREPPAGHSAADAGGPDDRTGVASVAGRGGAAACAGAVRARRTCRSGGVTDVRAGGGRARSPRRTADRAVPGRRRRCWPADLDAVYVCVPPFAHGPAEEAVIEAGAADLRGEAPRRRSGHRRADRRRGRRARAASPRSATTGATCRVVDRARGPARRPPGPPGERRLARQGAAGRPGGRGGTASGGPIVEQAAHVLDLARHAGRRGDRGVPRPATAPRRRSTAPTSTRPPRPRCGSPAARSARSPPPACWAGSTAPGWRSTPTGWRCRVSEDGLVGPRRRRRTTDRPAERPGGRPGRPSTGRSSTRSGATATTSGCPYAEALRTHRLALRGRRVGARTGRAVRPSLPAVLACLTRQRRRGAPARAGVRVIEQDAGRRRRRHVPGRARCTAGVSAGTELSFVKGTNPSLHAGWDAGARAVRRPGAPHALPGDAGSATWRSAGSSESRTPAVAEGTLVAMTYGHRTGYARRPARATGSCRCRTTSTRCSASTSRTWARSAPTACCTPPPTLHGADVRGARRRRARPARRGHRRRRGRAADRAVRPRTAPPRRWCSSTRPRSGARSPRRSAWTPWTRSDGDPAVDAEDRAGGTRPGDRGADVVFQCRGQASALHLALRLLRPQGT